MRKFIVKVCLFLFPFLVVFVTMEIALRKIPNDYSLKRKYLDDHASEIQTLILGTSHNFYGLNPAYFRSKTFNAAYLTQSLDYDYEIIKKYQDKFTNLKTVVLDISVFSLYSRLQNTFWIKNYILYYNMLNTGKSVKNYFEMLSSSGIVNGKRLYRFYIKKQQPLNSSENGWGTNYTYSRQRNLLKTGEEAAKRHNRDISLEKNKAFFESNCNTLRSIIKWAAQKKIRIVFITPPAYKSYTQKLDAAQLETTIKTIDGMVAENKHCSYFNFLSDTTFLPSDFFDGDHLDEMGAKKLSVLINEKIEMQ